MFQGIKIIILIFVFSISVFKAGAQYYYASYNYYTVGFKGGYDVYSYDFDPGQNVSYEAQPNFSLGVTGAYYATFLIELHADLAYSTRNFNVRWHLPDDPEGMVPALSEYKLAYIRVPLQARINAIYLNWVKLNLGAGIMPEFRLRPQEKVTYQNGSTSESQDAWLTKNFTSVLVAVPFSANLKINFSRHVAMELSAYYYLYLNEMHKEFMLKPGSAYGFYAGMFYEW